MTKLAKIADKPPPVATDPKSRCCICNEQIMPTEPFTFSRPYNFLRDGTVAHADCYCRANVVLPTEE